MSNHRTVTTQQRDAWRNYVAAYDGPKTKAQMPYAAPFDLLNRNATRIDSVPVEFVRFVRSFPKDQQPTPHMLLIGCMARPIYERAATHLLARVYAGNKQGLVDGVVGACAVLRGVGLLLMFKPKQAVKMIEDHVPHILPLMFIASVAVACVLGVKFGLLGFN